MNRQGIEDATRERRDYPLAGYGYPDIEAEDVLECPNCRIPFDVRFWGQAAVSFMRRDETYYHERGLMCPDCKILFDVDELVKLHANPEGSA